MKKILLLSLILSLAMMPWTYAKNTEDTWLRVGLKSQYERVSQLHFVNEAIAIGYALEDNWKEEIDLESKEGFIFQPDTSTYLISNEYLTYYKEALEAVDELEKEGLTAFAGSVSLGMWKLYIAPENGQSLEMVKEMAKGIYGLTYHIAEDNGLRVRMVGDDETIIFENSFAHPQFEPIGLSDTKVIDLGERQYRGRMEIGRYKKSGVTAINVISVEAYLYGVLPGEVIVTWPIEALKAQAVAARNYALYYSQIAPKYVDEAYDICDTVLSQVYKGYEFEDPRTNQAVDATKGKMIYYRNEIIPSYFFSTSGGHTENSENVWSAPMPYLQGVPDIYETEPERDPWIVYFTPETLADMLKKYDVNIGTVEDVVVTSYSESGRAMTLRIIGSTGYKDLNKETIRSWLGLNSRKFTVLTERTPVDKTYSLVNGQGQVVTEQISDVYTINGSGQVEQVSNQLEQLMIVSDSNIINDPMVSAAEGEFVFAGQGWGHGVGMSQSGAKGMASMGYTYQEILEYYYSGTEVK